MFKKLIKASINSSFYLLIVLFCSILSFRGVTQNLDLIIYDSLLNKFPKKNKAESKTIVVGITEKDIEKYGWPIDDIYLFEVIKNLDDADSSSIVLDLYRNVGVGKGADQLASFSKENQKVISIFNVAEGIASIPEFPVERQAFNDIPVDVDNVIRRNLVGVDRMKFKLPPQFVSIPSRMVEIHQKFNNEVFDIDEQFSEGKINTIKKYSGGYTNVDSNGFQILIDYPRSNYVPKYSIESILNKNFSKDFFKNKMVVIGATAPSLKDIFAFPSSRFIKDSQLMYISGAEIHAHRANQLLSLQNGNTLQINTINPTLELFLIILLTLSTAIYIEKSKKILYGLLGLIIIIPSLSIAVFLSFMSGYWIEFSLPIISIILVSTVSWVKKAAEQQKQKALMQKLLGQTTSPEVAEELWKQKDSLIENGKFPGTELPVTILFSDTVSFSSVSEKMTPTELLDWLNNGMEKFVKIISENGGMVNKFTGDGFLAVFGAPVRKSLEESSNASIKTAIEIRNAIDDLIKDSGKKNLPPLRLRIGIHSGKIITGSMGGAEKIEYALIGDSVNVAARLESLNKEKMNNNCRILVSGDSLKFLKKENYNIENWGECKVKGRESLVEVYEIL